MADNNTLLRWAIEYTPVPVIRQLKRAYWYLLSQPEVMVLPLEEAYGTVVRHQSVEAQLVPVPEAHPIPMAPFAPRLRNGRYKIPEDYVTVLRDVLYCPVNNVVMSEPGKIIAESLCAGINVKPFPRREKTISGYCTPWRTPKNNYYHTLIDNLPRIISLADFPTGEEESIRLIYSGQLTDAELFYLSEFCPPNMEMDYLPADSLYRIENLILTPFKTRRYAGYLPNRYASYIRTRLIPDRPPRHTNRLLVSRNNATRRRILNQAELSAALSPRGFDTVHLETLPFEKQIELFYDAEIVVGAHGAGLANVLFGNALQLVELFPGTHVVPHYFYLCTSLGHRYSFWCGRERSHHSDFEVEVGEVVDMLDVMGITDQKTTRVPEYLNPLQTKSSQAG